ncbi:MAG: BREX-1 system adenine-specific DNA-methyltransferase PglX, partial [Chromatiaceae bacterium]
MDKDTRNRIQRATQTARGLLEQDFDDQLAGVFDIRLDGTIAAEPGSHLDAAQRIVRTKLVAAVEHFRASGQTAAEAVASYRREAAFTTLNRFVALKMLEARGLVQECLSRGEQSSGFKEFCGLAPGLVQLPDRGYRLYIESLFDELSVQIRVLFNRRDASSLLWPKRTTLELLQAILNAPELAGVWGEDETLGWIYQYYNDEGERKKMREASAAPRNSRELAVRNQFFTPRYVVEFLTDNTLGRLWYEMTRGQTRLKEQCRYLVRRPTEIFLKPGETVPEGAAGSALEVSDTLSQEERLRQPVHIPYRPIKDPREIRLLDPACGSMHFGLYAFDLFAVIYDEAWDLAQGPDDLAKAADTFAPFVSFAASFPDKAAFLREVPRLIIEHNLHRIDIDRRAVQIAGLSLWLRAQRAWHQAGVKAADRPRITRSNIVCAEPMPGEKELLREFVEQQFPVVERPAFTFLLEKVFDHMTLAGEAGSLLRIEEEIREAIAEARALSKEQAAPRQLQLLPGDAPPEQNKLDLNGLTDEQFWQAAEHRIYEALRTYAEQTENGTGFRRRLFVDDAAQGFSFIDLCSKRYDAVVMNPPFGLVTERVFEFLQRAYPDNYVDIYAAFVARGVGLAIDGLIGAITSRSFISAKKLQRWRENQLLECLSLLIDLGKGVMDDANIESACYTIRPDRNCSPGIFAFDGRRHDAALPVMLAADILLSSGKAFLSSRQFLRSLPGSKLLYFTSGRLAEIMVHRTCFEPTVGTVRKGLTTFDDFRFLRVRWEVPPNCVSRGKTWELIAKGGEYSNYYIDVHLVVNRRNRGEELAEKNLQVNGQTAQSRQGETYYYKAGSQYTGRSQAGFSARAIPANCVMSSNAPMILSQSAVSPLYLPGWVNSRLIRSLIEMQAMDNDFVPGLLKNLPWLDVSKATEEDVANKTLELVETHRRFSSIDECDPSFRVWNEPSRKGRLSERFSDFQAALTESIARVAEHQSFISCEIDRIYDFDSGALSLEVLGKDVVSDVRLARLSLNDAAGNEVSYAVGCAFGRWDIRYATGERPAPELPEPFAPLPVCPPGMLQG